MSERRDWQPDGSRVLVVAAGRGAREQADRLNVYQCQNRRSFRPSRWIAFYASGRIDTLAEIADVPNDDVVISDRPELTELSTAMTHWKGNPREPRTLFHLKNITTVGPILNDQTDKNGRLIAWVQGQRYTTIEKLRSAKRTSDL